MVKIKVTRLIPSGLIELTANEFNIDGLFRATLAVKTIDVKSVYSPKVIKLAKDLATQHDASKIEIDTY